MAAAVAPADVVTEHLPADLGTAKVEHPKVVDRIAADATTMARVVVITMVHAKVVPITKMDHVGAVRITVDVVVGNRKVS